MLMDGDVGTSLIIWDAWSEKDDIILIIGDGLSYASKFFNTSGK